jgi:hypothetical protein
MIEEIMLELDSPGSVSMILKVISCLAGAFSLGRTTICVCMRNAKL